MLFKATAKDKETGKSQIIESDYRNKTEFIKDLRRNGFSVNPLHVKKSEVFDHIVNNTNCNEWDWEENN